MTIISRPGGFLRLEIVGRYCWRTLPYLISGEAKRRESTGHDMTGRSIILGYGHRTVPIGVSLRPKPQRNLAVNPV